LEIWGQINQATLHWNDGIDHNTYYGLQSANLLSKFAFRGEGAISPTVKLGAGHRASQARPTQTRDKVPFCEFDLE
jgi:hypothetical protein